MVKIDVENPHTTKQGGRQRAQPLSRGSSDAPDAWQHLRRRAPEEDNAILVSVPFNLWGSVAFQQHFRPQTTTSTVNHTNEQHKMEYQGLTPSISQAGEDLQENSTEVGPWVQGVWDEEEEYERAPNTNELRGTHSQRNEGE